jgi:hypothetical protein
MLRGTLATVLISTHPSVQQLTGERFKKDRGLRRQLHICLFMKYVLLLSTVILGGDADLDPGTKKPISTLF